MDKRITLIAGLTALFAMGSAHAYVCPDVEPVKLIVPNNINPETGHTFDVYKADGICWLDAQAFVNDLDPQGSPTTLPHLATITSSSENRWIVDELLTPALTLVTPLEQSQVWVGGFRDAGAWRWENKEGPFSGSPLNDSIGYTNWVNGEPNNTLPGENHLTLGRYPSSLYGWNDEGSAVGSIGGFIVEYDTPLSNDAGCTTTGTTTTCTTVLGQRQIFPPGTFGEGSSYTFTAYEYTDLRVNEDGRCVDRVPLTLFADDAFNLPDTAPGSESGKLVIPSYLCGSPKFVVVRAVATNINIPRGVVITDSDTEIILPDNIYDCIAPIPAGGSPQQQDVGVWQSLDATEMWESDPNIEDPRFDDGTAAELTTACASTLIKTRAKSNFVSGLHFDFGPDVAFRSTAEYVQIVALTQYKISLVRQSVEVARDDIRISDAVERAMLSQLDAAAAALAANNPVNARKKIQDFLKKVNSSTYSSSSPTSFNYNGDHLARGENILFTLNHKVIPFFQPVP